MISLVTEIGPPQYSFIPVWRPGNQLAGVELICCQSKRNTAEDVSSVLNEKQQLTIFNEKIAIMENLSHLFSGSKIAVWVNINDTIATEIMQDPHWIIRLQKLPALTLMMDESFSGMSYGRNNLRLIWLAEKFPLALANFGAGQCSNRAVFDGLFRHVFLDRDFIHNQSQRLSFMPFVSAIIRQVAPFCQGLMVSGIDDMALYNKVKQLDITGMCGHLWPAVTPDNLPTVLNTGKHTPS